MHEVKAQIIMEKQCSCLVVMVFCRLSLGCGSELGRGQIGVVGGTTSGDIAAYHRIETRRARQCGAAVLAIRSGKERIGKKNLTNLTKRPDTAGVPAPAVLIGLHHVKGLD